MPHWKSGVCAAVLLSNGVLLAAAPEQWNRPPLWAGKLAPPPLDPAISLTDFPPPADPPLPATAPPAAAKPSAQPKPVAETAPTRPTQAKPAVRTSSPYWPSGEYSRPESGTPAKPAVRTSRPLWPNDEGPSPASPAPRITMPAQSPYLPLNTAPPPPPRALWPDESPAVECETYTPECDRTWEPYGSAEYLLFKLRRGPTPPLVQVVSPENAQVGIMSGELPANASINIFDQFGTDPSPFSGARGVLGLWLDPSATWGAELGYMQIFRKSDQFAIASDGIPVIGRDFFDVSAGRDSFLRYTNPDGSQRGFIRIDAPTQAIGGEFNIRRQGTAIFADRTEYLAGFRYFNLRESIGIDSGSSFVNAQGQTTSSFDSSEFFRAKNDFYGGQIGTESHYYFGRWTIDSGAKIAIGNVRQDVRIEGYTIVNRAGQPTQFFPNQTLLFVQPTNAGRSKRDFAELMSDLFIRVGYQFTPQIRASIGYDMITLTNVIRAGSAIDESVNPNNTQFIARGQPNASPRPSFGFHGSDWWAQGLTAGLVVNY